MSKIKKTIVMLLVVLFVVTVTAGAVSAANYMYEKTSVKGVSLHGSGSLDNKVMPLMIISTQEIKKNQNEFSSALASNVIGVAKVSGTGAID